VAITRTSIVTSSCLRDPRFPPRPRSLEPTRLRLGLSPATSTTAPPGPQQVNKYCNIHDCGCQSRSGGRPWSPTSPPRSNSSAVASGSSDAVRLNKTTSVHDRELPHGTPASSGPRIKPLLEVLSPAVNGSPRSVSLNKTTTEHDSPQRPSTTAYPDTGARLSNSSLRYRGRRLQDRHDGSLRPAARSGDPLGIHATHERPFRSSSRSRSR
jgi:hypothetical protein